MTITQKTKNPSTIRLNRFLAQRGVASRRKADELIQQGRVEVGGQVITELGFQLSPHEQDVLVNKIPLGRNPNKLVYYLLYKPRGVVTTLRDPQGRTTVKDFFADIGERLFPVGRLDYDAEGVLLITNDGDLAHHLMHPRSKIKKSYLVKVKGRPSEKAIAKLRNGIVLEDGWAKPLALTFQKMAQKNAWFSITVTEGRNRLVKRMWQRVRHPVAKLIRTHFAGLTLKDLEPGELRSLTRNEISQLRALMSKTKKELGV